MPSSESESSKTVPTRPSRLRELAETTITPGERVLVLGTPHRVVALARTRWGSITCKVVRLEGDEEVGVARYVAPNRLERIEPSSGG